MIYGILAIIAIVLCFSEGQPQKGKKNGKVIEPSNTNGQQHNQTARHQQGSQ